MNRPTFSTQFSPSESRGSRWHQPILLTWLHRRAPGRSMLSCPVLRAHAERERTRQLATPELEMTPMTRSIVIAAAKLSLGMDPTKRKDVAMIQDVPYASTSRLPAIPRFDRESSVDSPCAVSGTSCSSSESPSFPPPSVEVVISTPGVSPPPAKVPDAEAKAAMRVGGHQSAAHEARGSRGAPRHRQHV